VGNATSDGIQRRLMSWRGVNADIVQTSWLIFDITGTDRASSCMVDGKASSF
jgi:hypothetical protein